MAKTCKSCGNSFGNWAVVNDKNVSLSGRKYCLTCSPYGTRKFCGPKPNPDGRIKGRVVERKCKECGKPFTTKHASTRCRGCIVSALRLSRKKKAVEIMGGCCQICRYCKCLKALDFHHIDPKTKEETLSFLVNRSWELFEKELKKCVLLCSRCHSEVHEGFYPEKEIEWQNYGGVGREVLGA